VRPNQDKSIIASFRTPQTTLRLLSPYQRRRYVAVINWRTILQREWLLAPLRWRVIPFGGAVEQPGRHPSASTYPLSQGYSKDPSVVAKAAIEHATEQGNDLQLIDTAGRMQTMFPP
jgi:hypothetical protein